MKYLLYLLCLLSIVFINACSYNKNTCNFFTDWVEPARKEYFSQHRLYPIPKHIKKLASLYQPELVIHPSLSQDFEPIHFEDYLLDASLVYTEDNTQKIKENISLNDLEALDYESQCQSYIQPAKQEIISSAPYPWYVQAFQSAAPGSLGRKEKWLYIKYNIIFNWSGLAKELSSLTKTALFFLRLNPKKWHRLDIHTSLVMAFDTQNKLRLITIDQHNYVRSYLAGVDFNPQEQITVAAALHSNELYLDNGSTQKRSFRVIPFYHYLEYLITAKNKPPFWGKDEVIGKNAGGRVVKTKLIYIKPQHPLAAYSGLLAPPRPLFGLFYIGRDGPMGYDYYAPAAAMPLGRLAAMGYWREGEHELVEKLSPLLNKDIFTKNESHMKQIIRILERKLAQDLIQKIQKK